MQPTSPRSSGTSCHDALVRRRGDDHLALFPGKSRSWLKLHDARRATSIYRRAKPLFWQVSPSGRPFRARLQRFSLRGCPVVIFKRFWQI